MSADRFNEGKRQWSLVDMRALEPMVEVLEFGATKYSRDNWKKGLKVSGIYDSLQRHLIELMEGKDLDEESNKLIIGHILCNVMFLSYMLQFKPDFDDRPKL